ncbi:hypothetical protein T265_10831 [Opisthorchis viverrini]|uniref:Uncharacterized protein n=1 Tax=Opisthorchis viverrini TaxID=6198 RepID=A0A074Z586_OPIVI|nr:hypothetical protein T265_10831 [Opisthorchis viverrini]KER20672.1 hypothetical protein T265_10831 [Opisthorchis viverrini]
MAKFFVVYTVACDAHDALGHLVHGEGEFHAHNYRYFHVHVTFLTVLSLSSRSGEAPQYFFHLMWTRLNSCTEQEMDCPEENTVKLYVPGSSLLPRCLSSGPGTEKAIASYSFIAASFQPI